MVRRSSHLGGHKYAGVVVIYPHGDWYGFVDKNKVDDLIDQCLLNDKIAAPMWRGRMVQTPFF